MLVIPGVRYGYRMSQSHLIELMVSNRAQTKAYLAKTCQISVNIVGPLQLRWICLEDFQTFYQELDVHVKTVVIVKQLDGVDHCQDNLDDVFLSVLREVLLHQFVEISINKNK